MDDTGVEGLGQRTSERIVVGLVAVALLLGIALYNVVPLGSGSSAGATSDALVPGGVVGGAATGPSGGGDLDATRSSSFAGGAGVLAPVIDAILGDGTATGAGAGTATVDLPGTPDAPDAPTPPEVPDPDCPTSVASDAYEQIVDPVSAATGTPLPRDNVRLLAEIAAGCSNEPATTPLIGLALDLARVTPDSGIEPIDLSAVPYLAAPEIPPGVIDALGALADPIRDGCANVSLLGILVAIVPGAAHVPVHGSDLAKVLGPAETLCAQFER